MPKFNVTYDIVTPESAEHGDIAEDGFIAENVGLRDAIDALFETRTRRVDGISYAESGDSYFTVGNGMEIETGAHETRRLHFPQSTTDSTWHRIARLLEARAGFKFHRG